MSKDPLILQQWRNRQADLIAEFCAWYDRKSEHNSSAYPRLLSEAEWGQRYIQFLAEEKR